MIFDQTGNYFLTGSTTQQDIPIILTTKCNSLGDTLWTIVYSGKCANNVGGISMDNLGNIILCGGTWDSLGSTNALIIKYGLTTNVKEPNPHMMPDFKLYQNYPNPFNPTTTIKYEVPRREFVSLKIYNVVGQEIALLVNEIKQPGWYTVQWNGEGYPSGVYLYQIQSASSRLTKKLLLIK